MRWFCPIALRQSKPQLRSSEFPRGALHGLPEAVEPSEGRIERRSGAGWKHRKGVRWDALAIVDIRT